MNGRLFFLAVLLTGVSTADQESQTDWTGGDGVPGPVTDWGQVFDLASAVNAGWPGLLRLDFDPVKTTVDNSLPGAACALPVDIDGDGDKDIAAAGYSCSTVSWWRNAGGTSWTEVVIDSGFPSCLAICPGDFDGDGDWDIVGGSYSTDQVVWWENHNGIGTSWVEHSIYDLADGVYSVYAVDMDENGSTDVVGALLDGDKVCWWSNNGTGTYWGWIPVANFCNGVSSVTAADIDSDGDPDVVGASSVSDQIVWWENMDGYGTTWSGAHLVQGGFDGAFSVTAEDVDQDGSMDIVGAAFNGNKVSWWRNADGSGGSWTRHDIDIVAGQASWVDAADMDADGDIDVAATASGDDDVLWYENLDGWGTEWRKRTLAGGYDGACSAVIADIDGNGRMDVAGSARNAGDVDWWSATRFALEGLLESSILDVQDQAVWQTIAWTSVLPTGTSIAFQVRSSDDPGDMGPWSAEISSPGGLSGYLTDLDDLVQYRAILRRGAGNQFVTPVLHDVTLSWLPCVGSEEHEACVPSWSFAPLQNPARGGVLGMSLGAAAAGPVAVRVFDLSGRVIAETEVQASAGLQTLSFKDLPAGVLCCTAAAPGYAETVRVVVID